MNLTSLDNSLGKLRLVVRIKQVDETDLDFRLTSRKHYMRNGLLACKITLEKIGER